MPKIEVMITSGATINQGVVAKGGGKALPMYTRNAGIIFLDPEDFRKLAIYPLTPVKLSNEFNEVIVYAQISPDAPHKGVGFMPRGPWCNLLIHPETHSSGCPMYKSTKVTIEAAEDGQKPLNMPELMKKYYIEQAAK